MSRRQNRKRRRARERRSEFGDYGLARALPHVSEEDFLSLPMLAPPALQCGQCREFVEDGEGGRGTCLHPASGIMFPWHNTPGCAFFRRA